MHILRNIKYLFLGLFIIAGTISCSAGTSGNSAQQSVAQPILQDSEETDAPGCNNGQVVVSGYAQSFVFDSLIKYADITVDVYNTPEQNFHIKTDKNGRFSFCANPGAILTLSIEKHSFFDPLDNYQTTQSETFVVPPEGISGLYNEITFQTPRVDVFDLLKSIIAHSRHIKILESGACQVSTTISGYHMTLKNDPQGVAGVQVTLNGVIIPSNSSDKPYYFGILDGKTDPFSSHLTATSLDGGVLIYNLPASDKIQTLGAYKPGVTFSEARFICKSGAFINIAPPRSPHCLTQRCD